MSALDIRLKVNPANLHVHSSGPTVLFIFYGLFILFMMRVKPEPAVQSIHRAADILKCISGGTTSVTDIAANCGLSKATVHRLLKALCESELVVQNPVSRQYFLGPQFVKLTLTPATSHEYLVDSAKKEMQRLSELTNETIDIRIMLGLKNIGLNLIQSKNDLIVPGSSFQIRPLSGEIDDRVLLAQLSDEQLTSVLGNIQIFTKRTNVGTIALKESIDLIRRQGYAVSSNELIMGFTCICAPVKNYLLPAVLLVVGPEFRVKSKIRDILKETIDSATSISASLHRFQNADLVKK